MSEDIIFKALEKSHFPLLLKWLETSHVKAWWDQDIVWTPELIEEKYGDYIHHYKRIIFEGKIIEKQLHAFIIYYKKIPIGYIQYYNIHDFPREPDGETIEFPEHSAAIDWYIGEEEYIGKGIGPKALDMFLKNNIFKRFDSVFIESESTNLRAIRAYEKIGFKPFKITNNGKDTWMSKKKVEEKK